MDDDIDIEEHDILEHPQVKAVFPDLSKIQIQVQTGAYECHSEEISSFLEERQDYTNQYQEDYENDKECIDEGGQVIKEAQDNLVVEIDSVNDEGNSNEIKHLTDHINDTVDELVELVHVISDDDDDEPITESLNKINEKLVTEIQPSHEGAEVNFDSQNPAHDEKIFEISDDEEPKVTNEIFDDFSNAVDEYILGVMNSGDKQTVTDDITAFEKYNENTIGYDEILENVKSTITEQNEVDQIDTKYNENTIGYDGILENVKSTITEQNEVDQIDTENSDSTPTELQYPEIPIKQEFYEVPIKEEIINEFDSPNFDEIPETLDEATNNFPSKIILGSKPSPTFQITDKSYLVVLLENWGNHLNESQSYCRDCKTLFTTPNALDCHNMISHSLLAPITYTNRALKSTAQSNRPVIQNLARKSTSAKDLSKSTHCSHCNVNFKDNTALIKHLYELLPIKQYSCNQCKETFTSQNDLVNHNAVHVKVEPRKFLKAKKNSDKNPLLRSLLTQESKKIPLKAKNLTNIIKRPIEIKTEPLSDSGVRYRCKVCSDILSSYGAARKHRRVHPEFKNQVLFKKTKSTKKLNSSKDKLVFEEYEKVTAKKVKYANENSSTKAEVQLIPKSALFQCSTCSLHFTTPIGGLNHMSHVSKKACDGANYWPCPICKKKFRKKDEECHLKQHKISTKLKIYKITKTVNERTLCKCVKCNVHFEYILMKKHYNRCGRIPTAKCQTCNILVVRNKLADHMSKHDLLKLKPKDFIFVDYAKVTVKKPKQIVVKKEAQSFPNTQTNNSPAMQVNIKPFNKIKPMSRPKPIQRQLNTNKRDMYCCKRCKMCLSSLRFVTKHLLMSCVNDVGSRPRSFCCNLCGLLLPRKSQYAHAQLHAQKNLTLKDYSFFDMATLKPIAPPLINYPACKTCKIHFLTRGLKRSHICGEDYENCEFCSKRYEISTLKVHREFHKLQKSKPGETRIIEAQKAEIIPELMMRYESLNPIWNILYLCGKCEVVTDLYNNAVEHSQAHLRKKNMQLKTVKCKICKLNLDETCWTKHKELHTRMSIKPKEFKVLKYAPQNLLEESWFQMFESLPEKEIRQIIDQSVFGSERSLQMKLIKYGLPEFTLYCCSNCQICCENNNLTAHINSKCKASTYRCAECEISFESAKTLNFHSLLHERGIKREEFRIIHFIKKTSAKSDAQALAHLSSVQTNNQLNVGETPNQTLSKSRKHFCLYRCTACSVCVHLAYYQAHHICSPAHHLFFCKLCKENFTVKQKRLHNLRHKESKSFKAVNIKVVPFHPKTGEDKLTGKRDIESLTSTATKTSKDLKPSKSKEDLTSLYSPIPKKIKRSTSVETFESMVDIVTSDRYKDLDSSQDSDISLAKNRKSVKVYKCDCGLHYTSLKTIEKHFETCGKIEEISKENCSKCGLLFPTEILVSHLCKHHSHDSEITIEEVKNHRKYFKLYKCAVCQVNYLNQTTCYKHTHPKHVKLDPKQYIDCKICNFAFTLATLPAHMRKHHESDFNLDKVLIEEYHPDEGKGVPKIDIYFASQKVQNVQVSSSND